MSNISFPSLSKRDIREALATLTSLTSDLMSGDADRFEDVIKHTYTFFAESPVMQALLADFSESRFLESAKNLEAKKADSADAILLTHWVFHKISHGQFDLVEWGVKNGELQYDDIVAKARRILTPLLDACVAKLRWAIDSITRDKGIPAVWLSLLSPTVPTNVKDGVQRVLREVQAARSDDKRLIYEYLKRYHRISLPQEIFDPSVPSFETIRRSRQLIQREGHYREEDVIQLTLDLDKD